ncbi:MAG: M12 family metallopeptidase [Myxococcota bacterium]
MTTDDGRTCFAWFEERARAVRDMRDDVAAPGASADVGRDRAALWARAKWVPGQIIGVAFLGASDALAARVLAAARAWVGPGMANLELQLRLDPADADLRVAFVPGGSWSVVGTTCRLRPKAEPTMNLGWLDDATPDDELRAVVLHEFGHALGLIHEHASPAGGIRWNRDAVYADLSGPPNCFTRRQIDANMFQAWDAAETNFTAFDAASIMLYPIPAAWTLDGFSVGLNTTLSPTDKSFIAAQYPF